VGEPRLWWQDVLPSDWMAFSLPDDLVRERYSALLAALEELSTRGPMSTLGDILSQLRSVGFHDPLTEAELRGALDQLAKWGFAEPFRDYAAPVRGYQGLTARQEAWALTRKGRGIVAAVRSAVVDAGRALQLPSRLLDSVEHTIRGMLRHLGHDDGLLPVDLDDTRTRIEEMQRVTADFYTALAQMVQSDVTDDGLFGENRDRVIEALRQFPREYGRALRRVEAALADLREAGHRRLVESAVPHAGLVDARDEHYWVDERVRRLSDLEAWFEPDGTVRRLVASATGAVYTLLVAIDRRHAARRRGSDLGADFRALAYSLHRQPSDADARRVYAAAFGDWPAWHAVCGTPEEDVAHGSAAEAGGWRRQVEVTLREHERHGPPGGRPRKVPDTNADREAALAEAAAEAARNRRYTAILATDGEVGLEHFSGLQTAPAVILFQAIESALAQFDVAKGFGLARAEGASVMVEVRGGARGRSVRVDLAEGELTGPDLRIRVIPTEDLSAESVERAGSVA
jgi:uncharacterized protein (TIGR02677 family)